MRKGGVAAAIGMSLWAAAASAEPFAYLTQGNLLVRADGRTIDTRDLSVPSIWRRVFQLRGAASDIRLDRLTCDPRVPEACFVALASPGADRRTWLPLSLTGRAKPPWAKLADLPAEVEDVDARSGEILVVIKAAAVPRPADPAPGFYLYRDASPPVRIGDLAGTVLAIHHARFLRGEAGAPDILLMRGGKDGAWITLHGDLSPAGTVPWTGEPRALDGHDIIFAAEGPAGGSLWRMPLEGLQAGRPSGLYAPDGGRGDPPIARLAAPYFPGDVVTMASGRVLALAAGPAGEDLVAFCAKDPAAAARPFAAELGGAPVLTLAGGGDHAVAARFNAWGQRRFYLVSDPAQGSACAGAPQLEALPVDDRDLGPLLVDHRSVAADDGETIPYAVLGEPGRHGPVLLRVYGGNDVPALAMAATPFERQWLQRGGRLVVPTLRGDARVPPWKGDAGGDYQVRAVKDLFSVIDEMVARREARPGEINILGDSLGAFTAARAALTRPELFNAALLVSGALDLDLQAKRITTGQTIGPAAGGFAAWYGAAPSPQTCATVRLFAYTGGADPIVEQANSANFTAYAQGLKYRARLKVYPRADHGLLELPTVADAILFDLGDVARAKALCRKDSKS